MKLPWEPNLHWKRPHRGDLQADCLAGNSNNCSFWQDAAHSFTDYAPDMHNWEEHVTQWCADIEEGCRSSPQDKAIDYQLVRVGVRK